MRLVFSIDGKQNTGKYQLKFYSARFGLSGPLPLSFDFLDSLEDNYQVFNFVKILMDLYQFTIGQYFEKLS